MEDDEDKICHMCPTTEAENGAPLVWVDWMAASVCGECAHFFGLLDDVVGDLAKRIEDAA